MGEVKTYFIQNEESGFIKIGRSSNPAKRFSSIQTSNPDRLVFLGISSTLPEKDLHIRFKESRHRREWFSPSDELIDFLNSIGIKASQLKKRGRPPVDDAHPFYEASKLTGGGEWYDDHDLIDPLLCRLSVECEESEEVEHDEEWEDCHYCIHNRALEDLGFLFDEELVDGFIFNEEEDVLTVIIKRDAFGRHFYNTKSNLRALFDKFDTLGRIELALISWTESDGFRYEDLYEV